MTGIEVKGVVKILEVFETTNYFYLIKPYIEGVNLSDYLNERQSFIEVDEIKHTFYKILDIVQALHELNPPMIIRDLKPENFIVSDSGELILIDLESYRVSFDPKVRDTVLIGTPGFASPEHFGARETDVRSDVYSLGMILYFMTTNTVLMNTDRLENKMPYEAMRHFGKVIKKATRFDPSQRYGSVKAMKSDMDRYQILNHFGDKKKIAIVSSSVMIIVLVMIVFFEIKAEFIKIDNSSQLVSLRPELNMTESEEKQESDKVTSVIQANDEKKEQSVLAHSSTSQNNVELDIKSNNDNSNQNNETDIISKHINSTSLKNDKVESTPTSAKDLNQPSVIETKSLSDSSLKSDNTNKQISNNASEVATFIKGTRTTFEVNQVRSDQERTLPWSGKEVPDFENDTFRLTIIREHLPESLRKITHIEALGANGGIDDVYKHCMSSIEDGSRKGFQVFETEDPVFSMNSSGSYYNQHFVIYIENDTIKGIVQIKLDGTVKYKTY